MKKILPFNQAIKFSLILFGLLILFHLSIIIGIVIFDFVPIEFLWGGRMETKGQLLNFEIISLLVMVFCLMVVLLRSERIKMPALAGFSRVVLWILFVLFIFNTVGNILAETAFEKGFAIITILLAVLCLRMALEPIEKKGN